MIKTVHIHNVALTFRALKIHLLQHDQDLLLHQYIHCLTVTRSLGLILQMILAAYIIRDKCPLKQSIHQLKDMYCIQRHPHIYPW